jgi:hypothetical protein
MKRIMMVAVMMCLGSFQIMAQTTGQTPPKPVAHPTAKPATPPAPKSTSQAATKPATKPASANHPAGSGATGQQPEHAWKAGDQHDEAEVKREEERRRAEEHQREVERVRAEQAWAAAHQSQGAASTAHSTPNGGATAATPNATASTSSINSPITDAERLPEGMEDALNSARKSASTAQGQGPEGDLKCLGPEKHPCTENVVQFMERKLQEKRSEHREFAEISSLRLYSPNGKVSCRQKDGNSCTAEQVRLLNEHVAQPMMCDLRFEHELPNTTNSARTAGTGTTSPNTGHSAAASSKTANSATGGAASSNTTSSGAASSKTGNSAVSSAASSNTTSSAGASSKTGNSAASGAAPSNTTNSAATSGKPK